MRLSPQLQHAIRAALLVVSRAGYLLSSLLLLLLLVRLMPLAEMDSFSLAQSWLAVLVVAFDFGLNEYMVRAVSAGGERSNPFKGALVAKALLVVVVSAIYLLVAGLLYAGKGHFLVLLCTCGVAAARGLCDFAENALIARGKTRAVFRFATIQALAALGAGLLAAKFIGATAVVVLESQILIYAVLGILRLTQLDAFHPNGGDLRALGRAAPGLILAAVPFGAMSVGGILMANGPLIVMSTETRFVGSLASFAAASRIWGAFLAFGQGPFTRLYAVFSMQEASGESEASQRLASRMVFPLGGLGLAISLGTILCGAPLMRWVWASKFPLAYQDFAILGASLPFALGAYIPGAWLPARHREREKMFLVVSLCALLWLCLWLTRHQLTETLAACLLSGAWIVQSVAFWLMVSGKGGIKTGWLRPNFLPGIGLVVLAAGSASGVLGKLAGLLFGGFVLAANGIYYRRGSVEPAKD
jgi:O-antigen/teichoic acid export membrane protein